MCELTVNTTAGGTNEGIKVQADVLRHHCIAIKAALVGWVGALKVAQVLNQSLVMAFIAQLGHACGVIYDRTLVGRDDNSTTFVAHLQFVNHSSLLRLL